MLKIVKNDPYLKPYEEAILGRYKYYKKREADLAKGSQTLSDFASGYLYFGLHKEAKKWIFREWAPNATDIYLVGTFNDWKETPEYKLTKGKNGVWQIELPEKALKHEDLFKLKVYWNGGCGERIPAWARRVVQDDVTKIFSAQVWAPKSPYKFKVKKFKPNVSPLLIYECHIGMAGEEEKVSSYKEFREKMLPRIAADGYNCVQIMAIQEHPYYGSFGYHVSSFFAASSRFGTPDELKELIDEAHSMGLAVIMDLVHAHYVKNFDEGINELDGSDHLYSKAGDAGYQKYWDSKTFDYGKREVQHFLLSNVKYWLDEYHFDGYRFDGVTSMLYHHHGYVDFDCRERFFDEGVNRDAIAYLTLANKLIHDVRPDAITIAEDVSGMPGSCVAPEEGGMGFDYRLGMAIPDYWIKLLKEQQDEDWNIWEMWSVMTNRLPSVRTVAYAESHDQALVGDKTLAFRLMDKEMYFSMDRASENLVIDRGMALHKLIRLFTITTGGEAYLNFMGNEFGHPEWIDFPREGNNWSYKHARRQWSLAENGFLRYSFLAEFDKAMIAAVKEYGVLGDGYPYNHMMDEQNKTMVYSHKGLLFVLNWHPTASIPNYRLNVPWAGKYTVLFSTDESRFGGHDRADVTSEHFTTTHKAEDGSVYHTIDIYNTSRTGVVLKWEE